ncbi:MAG TPA: hypothetical protein PKC11_02555, partial [Agitococcus sp.]|nr:hypothetical protein [Agitococcus sp.]
MQLKKRPCDKHGQSIFLDFIRTYAVIAYLFTFQPFSTVLCSPNARLKVKRVSPELLFLIIATYYDILD